MDSSGLPLLLAVDDDPRRARANRARAGAPLRRRLPRALRRHGRRGPGRARAGTRAAGEPVALVLAAQWTAGTTGAELLARARQLHPHAKRGLLIEWGAWGDRATADAIFKAMALGDIDYYVLKPWWSPDEQFHRTIAEFLYEWTRALPAVSREVEVVGERWSPRAHELRSLLARNGVPHAFHASDSPAGRERLEAVGQGGRTRAGGDHARRAGAGRPVEGRARGGLRRLDRAARGQARLRRGGRRRRAGGPGGGGLRRLGGARDAGGRARGARRSGGLELADPQLPRLLARGQRLGAGAARLPAGLGLRHRLRADARRHLAAHRRRPARAVDLRRQRGQRARGRARDRRVVPPPRRAEPRGAASAPASTTALRPPRRRRSRAGRRTWSAAATRPARRPST